MKLHIFDSTGDTVVDCDAAVEEAERVAQEAWQRGSSIFTKEGERIKDLNGFREAARRAEDAYVVPQLRGG